MPPVTIQGTDFNVSASEMTSGPSNFDVWVNAPWFTSLTLSMGTTLMAVLVKQLVLSIIFS